VQVRYSRQNRFGATDLGHELLLYDPQGREVLVLNHTAKFIWILCSAPRSVPEIVQALFDSFEHLEFETATIDVEDLLQNQCRFLSAANEQSINPRGAIKCGDQDMSEKRKASTDRLSEPPGSAGLKPAYVTPDVKNISEELFRALLHSVNPLQFGDTWEGCFGDAVS
jgi:hypothetical protein